MPPPIVVDYETFYDKEKYSVKELGNWKYCRHELFDPYLISVCDGAESWAGHPRDFNFESLRGRDLLSHHEAFDSEVTLAAEEKGLFKLPGMKAEGMTSWYCTMNMAGYLWNVRSLAEACQVGLGVNVDKGVRDKANGKTADDMKKEGWWPDMVRYSLSDAQLPWHLWARYQHQWPQFERDLARQTTDQGRYGIRIDIAALEQGISTLQRVIFNARLNLPWIARGNKPASPIGIAEECRLHGIPSPPVKCHNPEAAQEWEDLYAPKFKFVLALRNIRKAKKTLATLETIKLRLRPDETVAFALKCCGAHTLRWSGDGGWNLQNLNKEPLFFDPEFSFIFDKKACASYAEEFDSLGGVTAAGVLKNGTTFFDIRGLVIARPGMKLGSVDASQIEPRVLNFLIGNEALLEKIRRGMSIYEAFARTSLGWAGGELKGGNKKLYALSKADVLGLGYRSGWEKFITVAWEMARVDITEDDEDFAKAASVDGTVHKRVRHEDKWWYYTIPEGADKSLKCALELPGGNYAPAEDCVFVQQIRRRKGEEVLVTVPLPVYGMRSRITVAEFRKTNPLIVGLWERFDDLLESSVGEDLVVQGPHGGTMTYKKVRQERRKQKNKDTGEEYTTRVFTAETGGRRYVLHGGVLTENLIQWVSRMAFAENELNLDRRLREVDPRQRVLFTVHDEAVCELADPCGDAEKTKGLVKFMEKEIAAVPTWLAGCPLAAEAKVLTRYVK